MREDMMDEILEHNASALLLDGHDNAIVGMVKQHGSPTVVLYDPLKIIGNLMENDGMTHEEAIEFFSYNIECAFAGPNTPSILVRLETIGGPDDADVEEGNA